MWRHRIQPREGWERIVTEQGLVYPVTALPDGTTKPYWNESAWYEFTIGEVESLEAATEELWAMCVDAAGFMASADSGFTDARLGLPAGALDVIRRSMERQDPMLYARFDLVYGADGSIKMLEINGDTPTGLVETGVAQWRWLEDVMPDLDQWNSVHDRLVNAWRRLRNTGAITGEEVHFLYDLGEGDSYDGGEIEMTVYYLMDTAIQAGFATLAHPMAEVGWNPDAREFRDVNDYRITNAFKLYAWEEMLGEAFGRHLIDQDEARPVNWFEPAWKAMLSTKALLPVLWARNPGHRLLLPAWFDSPGDLTEWVAKPLFGREGDNIRIHLADGSEDLTMPGPYGAEGYVYQSYTQLPVFEGNQVVLGSWIIDNEAAGMIVRESDGMVTDYFSRVVPHVISDTLGPDSAQVEAWLLDRVGPDAPRLVAKHD
jgi:glutathionylspermidine synthase